MRPFEIGKRKIAAPTLSSESAIDAFCTNTSYDKTRIAMLVHEKTIRSERLKEQAIKCKSITPSWNLERHLLHTLVPNLQQCAYRRINLTRPSSSASPHCAPTPSPNRDTSHASSHSY